MGSFSQLVVNAGNSAAQPHYVCSSLPARQHCGTGYSITFTWYSLHLGYITIQPFYSFIHMIANQTQTLVIFTMTSDIPLGGKIQRRHDYAFSSWWQWCISTSLSFGVGTTLFIRLQQWLIKTKTMKTAFRVYNISPRRPLKYCRHALYRRVGWPYHRLIAMLTRHCSLLTLDDWSRYSFRSSSEVQYDNLNTSCRPRHDTIFVPTLPSGLPLPEPLLLRLFCSYCWRPLPF